MKYICIDLLTRGCWLLRSRAGAVADHGLVLVRKGGGLMTRRERWLVGAKGEYPVVGEPSCVDACGPSERGLAVMTCGGRAAHRECVRMAKRGAHRSKRRDPTPTLIASAGSGVAGPASRLNAPVGP